MRPTAPWPWWVPRVSFVSLLCFNGPKMAQPTSLDHWPVQQPTRVLTSRQ
jgi:hypothetical protein